MENEKKFAIKYKVEPGEFTVDQAKAEGASLCDAILWAEIFRDESGNPGGMWASCDSGGGKLKPITMFQVWAMLAHHLSSENEISFEFRDIAQKAFERVQKHILSQRDMK